MFEGRAPSFADQSNVNNNNPVKFENIGMTTNAGTQTTNASIVKEANLTGRNGGNGQKPRSTLISRLKLAGECVGNGRGGRQNAPTGGACQLTAEMGNKANVAIKGTQVQLSRTADGVWSCKIKPNNTGSGATTNNSGWKDKFIPSGCSKATTGNAGQGLI